MGVLTLFFLFFIKVSLALQFCEDLCSSIGPGVRFPFGLDSDGCSYPGFNLSCNEKGLTILNLPLSGNFIVQHIDYQAQEIRIRDPGNCFAKRLLHKLSLQGSPFVRVFNRAFSFLNCSSNFSTSAPLPRPARLINCLSNNDFTVVAMPVSSEGDLPSIPSCTVMKEIVDVPVFWPRYPEGESSLIWTTPDCVGCEQNGGTCGFKDSGSLEIECFNLPSTDRGMFSIAWSNSYITLKIHRENLCL